jgi:major membrane immunogen (membrane-anchored lipoprotein)
MKKITKTFLLVSTLILSSCGQENTFATYKDNINDYKGCVVLSVQTWHIEKDDGVFYVVRNDSGKIISLNLPYYFNNTFKAKDTIK